MKEERIIELQKKIATLSVELEQSAAQLRELQGELYQLRREAGMETTIATTDSYSAHSHSRPFTLERFIGLRLINMVGIVVLVIGISIGVKYAIDKELISQAMRIILAYSAGSLLLFLSHWLRKKYEIFSAILFSGSMASLYFTSYGAFVYYHFMPAPIAFIIMIALTIYTSFEAIRYNRQEIASFGMVGAYGIPFLISQNAERVDLFFTYIFLINVGVTYLIYKKSWQLIGQMAMYITWLLFIGWAFVRYDSTQHGIAILAITIFYLLFLISALLRPWMKKTALSAIAVRQVVANNTLLFFALIMVAGSLAIIAGTLQTATGIQFIVITTLALLMTVLFREEKILQRILTWQAISMAVVYIACSWDGVIVTLLWLAIAILLFVWGVFNKRAWPRLSSVLLIGITLVKLIAVDSARFSTVQKIIAYLVIGVLLLVFSFYYQKFELLSFQKKKEE